MTTLNDPRLDPTRVQAKRLIASFEAYGIARQQIPRLLPAGLKLPNAAFSTAVEPSVAAEEVGRGAQRGVLKVVSLNQGIR